MRFETKIAIALRADLLAWQKLNVTAFLASAIAGAPIGASSGNNGQTSSGRTGSGTNAGCAQGPGSARRTPSRASSAISGRLVPSPPWGSKTSNRAGPSSRSTRVRSARTCSAVSWPTTRTA